MKFTALLLLFCLAPGCQEKLADSERGAGTRKNQADPVRVNPTAHGLIVVLGSSTAAGTGPKQPRNAWVPRYQTYLAERYPNVTLVNLAVGGQTTFQIQPTDYAPPPNRPLPVPSKNITAALALNPAAIILNFPSNDQAANYPLAEQLANYDRVAALAASHRIELWVSTSQPRNFVQPGQLEQLMQARDELLKKFGPHALDFWTPFAAANGYIQASYDSGDGTHLNDAAHAILARIVQSARIPDQFAAPSQ